LDSFRAANDRYLDHIAERNLQWPSLRQAESRVRMMVLVTELQMRLLEYFGFEFHLNIRSWPSSGSVTVFFCEPQTSSGTRVANATAGGYPNRKRGSADAVANRFCSSRSGWLRKRCHMTTCPRNEALLSMRFFPASSEAGYECGMKP